MIYKCTYCKSLRDLNNLIIFYQILHMNEVSVIQLVFVLYECSLMLLLDLD